MQKFYFFNYKYFGELVQLVQAHNVMEQKDEKLFHVLVLKCKLKIIRNEFRKK